jgi:transposase InsO family protein
LRRRRRSPVQRHARAQPTAAGQVWTLDFVSDQLIDGARFRALTVLDVHTRLCLAIEVGAHLRGEHVVATLERLQREYGAPMALFCDNVALHPGTVIYGNVGASDRLDFTAIGPAVNLVSRVETVAKALDEPIVVTDEFAQAYGGPLRSLGIHQFRGVAKPCELFAPDGNAAAGGG